LLTFACSEPLPSTRIEAYHLECMPDALSKLVGSQAEALWKAAITPPGAQS
jgi:hypothetical protein